MGAPWGDGGGRGVVVEQVVMRARFVRGGRIAGIGAEDEVREANVAAAGSGDILSRSAMVVGEGEAYAVTKYMDMPGRVGWIRGVRCCRGGAPGAGPS